MPTLNNAHVHIGYEGYTTWSAENNTPENIRNTRQIDSVYLHGTKLDRDGLLAGIKKLNMVR